MTVKTVLRMGHPTLTQLARPVQEFNTPALNDLIADMFDTMRHLSGAGLAAPQIGLSLRVVIFGFGENSRYPEAETVPETILINPEVRPLGDDMEEGWEGCLSVPGLRGRVPRYARIRYTGFDPLGEKLERDVSGFHARVVQHEVDHLDGILYPQRIRDFNHFGFENELFGHEN